MWLGDEVEACVQQEPELKVWIVAVHRPDTFPTVGPTRTAPNASSRDSPSSFTLAAFFLLCTAEYRGFVTQVLRRATMISLAYLRTPQAR